MNKVDFDQFTGKYNDLLREQTKFFSADEAYFARYKVELTRRLMTDQPRHILEYGCGIGRNIPFLRSAFPRSVIFGTDISARSIEVARQMNPGVAFWLEAAEPAVQSEFDLIFVAGVFHHIPPAQRMSAMNGIASLLSSNGRVIVFEHNPFNPVTRRIVSSCPYDADAVLLRQSELTGLLSSGGLRIKGRGYCLFVPPKLKRFVGVERYIGWLPLGGQYWVCAAMQ